MVTYNSDDNALELSDEDKLKVGDYELGYDSEDDEFQITDGDGNVNSIPRSTEGSLVPQGLAESVSEGKALADDGEIYDTVQEAVDNADGWVFVGSGTFNESVTIDTEGLTLEGCGYSSNISPSSGSTSVKIGASDITVQNIRCSTTNNGIDTTSETEINNISINSLHINSDRYGILNTSEAFSDTTTTNSNWTIINCNIDSDNTGIFTKGSNITISSNIVKNVSNNSSDGISCRSRDSIISNCIVDNIQRNGIGVLANDSIAISNRVSNCGSYGFIINGDDCIIANNRISDSGNTDIEDRGTGTELDDNLTGASN